FAHPAHSGPYAGARRLRFRPRQGCSGRERRPDALTAAGALSRAVGEIRRRPVAGGDHAAQLHGALLRHRYGVLHRAFPVALGGKNPALGRRVLLRGGVSTAAEASAFETLSMERVDEYVTIIRLN